MTESGLDLPFMVSGTIEPMGTMLAGQGVDALHASLEHLGLFCDRAQLRYRSRVHDRSPAHARGLATGLVSVYPNAGPARRARPL